MDSHAPDGGKPEAKDGTRFITWNGTTGTNGLVLPLEERLRRIDHYYGHWISWRVGNQNFQRQMTTVRYRHGSIGTPSGDIARMVRIEATAVHISGAGEATGKEWAQRYDRQTDSDDGQYELGIAIIVHCTRPPIITLMVTIFAVTIRTTLDTNISADGSDSRHDQTR
jgi:hypothetical protein